ncbi:hypothetical protein K227x_30810 [Rubripirellula lacrimiformis]|uniref:Uncharacterized protein n=1 Tax=Rubripirellula lacrimiformis TaxID=1930273 RepID=A0A517NC27_9BACT|nr:hypothetical protein K227x_30810 [Rubripirellula lacrimiformis]
MITGMFTGAAQQKGGVKNHAAQVAISVTLSRQEASTFTLCGDSTFLILQPVGF